MDLSTDNFINASQFGGILKAFIAHTFQVNTAATINSGYTSARHVPEKFTIPSLGTGVNGCYLTSAAPLNINGASATLIGPETILGSLTVSGNSFSSGTAMPTKTIAGVSTTTAAIAPMVLITTNMTATTPVLTITYTNQAGVGSRTCTMTLPTNAAGQSVYFMTPHLQAGDTGVRSVQNISISTGSAGAIQVIGCLSLYYDANSSFPSGISPLAQPIAPLMLAAGDTIGVIYINQGNNNGGQLIMTFTPDV